ncbi:hypothetical protein [Halorubrum sp. AJ67]|uniref:hypothetical protein n=1 Tax=Halorubrum sp. AJ67 TaxID=1173487 RepID=UPI0012ABB310|nr:hypothetical protein [Halorubrum sp. AJ67]
MSRNKFTHKRHGDSVTLETREHTDHPVLDYYVANHCPRDDCRFRVLTEYQVDHDVALSFDLDDRLDALQAEINLPVIDTYHSAGGHQEGRKAFQTLREAKLYIFGRYGGIGNRNAIGNQIRRTHSLTSGTHSQNARKVDHPMICAIVDTHQDKPVYTNLVPRDEDIPSNAPSWRNSIESRVEYHLNPPEHIIESKLGEDDQFARIPDGYEHDALAWHVEQVSHWEFQIQTPELLLEQADYETGVDSLKQPA